MSGSIYFVGELSGDEENLLKSVMENLGSDFPYKISKFTNNLFVNSAFIKDDIAKSKPSVIVCLGSKSLGIFGVEFEDKMAAVRKQQFSFYDIPIHCTYSPRYILKMAGAGDVTKLRDYLVLSNDIRQYYQAHNDNYKEEKFSINLFFQDQVLDYIKLFASTPDREFALDIEGSSLEPLQKAFRMGGIGICNTTTSAYLCFRDYTNPAGEILPETKQKLVGLITFLDKAKTCCFNAGYEYPALLNTLGVRLDNIVDVFMDSKALDLAGGLKDQSQLQLGVRGWTNEIEEGIELLGVILNCFKPTSTKTGLRDKKEFLQLTEKGIKEAVAFITGKELKNTETIVSAFAKWLKITTELYESEDLAYQYLEQWIKYKHTENDFEIRYTDLPSFRTVNGEKKPAYISHYCCLDCHYTLQLKHKYKKELKEKKLEHAAEVYNRQMWFSNQLEINGFKWDDEKAEVLKKQYIIEMTASLRNFLLLNRTKKILEINPVQEIEILSATTLDVLKKYFNPDSTAPANTEKLSKILSTDKIKMAAMFGHLNTEYQQIDSTVPQDYPLLCKLMLSFAKKESDSSYVGLVIQAIIRANQNDALTLQEKALLGKYAQYTLPNATAETIESLANAAVKYLGVDLDKEETWTEDYKLIFYYKLTKKISKCISAFIDGANARKLVVIVEKEKNANGYYTRIDDYRPLNDSDLDIGYITKLISQNTVVSPL